MKKTGDLNFAIFFTDVLLLKKKKKQVNDVTKYIFVIPTNKKKKKTSYRCNQVYFSFSNVSTETTVIVKD